MLLRTEGIGNRRFDCVYFGGGTPSDFSAKNLETILTVVREFQLSADCEITLEGRVSSLQNDKIAVCRNFGVNRYSLGVQSFNTGLRRAMGRISTRKEVIAALQNLRKTADAAVVIDQIYGLPGQNMNMWLEDLDTLFDECPVSGVDHYPLIQMPGTPLDHAVMAGALATPPDARLRADMFNTALDRMKDHDVHRASLKHFAFSPQERNRYNRLQAYGGCCVPAGCGGGGNIGGYFFYQAGSLENYFQAIDLGKKPLTLVSEVSDEERFLNTLSGEILTRCGFSLSTLQRHFQLSLDLEQCLHPLLKQYDESGLLSVDNNGSVFLTRAGQFWNNAIFQNLKKLYLTTVKQEKK
ncbi:MAG: radical SAM protein [Evtepia sp.]